MTAVDVLGWWGLVLIGVGGRYGADRGFTVGRSTSVMGLRAAQTLSTAVEVKEESKPVWREIWRGCWATLRVKWFQREGRALCNSCVCVDVTGDWEEIDSQNTSSLSTHQCPYCLPYVWTHAENTKLLFWLLTEKVHVGQWQIAPVRKKKIYQSNSKHVKFLEM